MDNDLISRSALKAQIKQAGWIDARDRSTAVHFINIAPTADVAPAVYGWWVSLEPEIGLFSCSLCEHKILRAKCNYCPNCGARMDGGEGDG